VPAEPVLADSTVVDAGMAGVLAPVEAVLVDRSPPHAAAMRETAKIERLVVRDMGSSGVGRR
jgi:hypothetical protein